MSSGWNWNLYALNTYLGMREKMTVKIKQNQNKAEWKTSSSLPQRFVQTS